ncbi:MAG: ion transporter [Lachnospiraceae bacterium]|nr:ion transporter [Lachnospiraceae bacterium]
MKKLKSFVESTPFQNAILIVILINSVIMGLQTSERIVSAIGPVLTVLDNICLGIFIAELLLKIVTYGLKFFVDGWNWFDLIVVVCSLISGLAFLKVLRVFRIFRVFRTFKALKGIRAFRLVSRLDKLRLVFEAIRKSIPGISWSGALLLLIYYIFALIGTTLFGVNFPDWFGSIGKSLYTLFQVMTLESWSMGISRPVMDVFPWAWVYFVPFVLISSFVIMNVVVGIVVNSISEVQMELAKEKAERKSGKNAENKEENSSEASCDTDKNEQIKEQLSALKEQISELEKLL